MDDRDNLTNLGNILEVQRKILIKNPFVYDLLKLIGKKDDYTEYHCIRVASYALELGKKLKIDEDLLKPLLITGLFHDIGKIKTPQEILIKPGRLTENEFKHMKKHVTTGSNIIQQFDYDHLDEIKYGIKEHHERYDGKTDCNHPSYLGEKKGEALSLFARILKITDSYDAMTTNRPYRNSLNQETALNELIKYSGTEFSPDFVKVFIDQSIYKLFS